MSKRILLISPAAKSDLRNILQFSIDNWGNNTATSYMSYLEKQLKLVRDHSHIGNPCPEFQLFVRSRSCKSHVIYYRVDEQTVEIIRILHGHQDPTNNLL